MPAKLLVSVRSPQEATAALEGGADIVDVKEPARGPLGAAGPGMIAEVTELVRERSSATVVSAALGEVGEFVPTCPPLVLQKSQPDLVKSGLSGLRGGAVSWQQAWHAFRKQCYVRPGVQWVAVSYADHERSGSPSPVSVFEEGHRMDCPVLLIDTFQKDGTTLIDWLSAQKLNQLRQMTRAADMKLALAGQITATVLPQVLAVDPDIVAVRGAVCESGDRGAAVNSERVRELATALHQQPAVPAVR